MSKLKTKKEIINETVKYYSEDTTRRSVIGKSCVYIGIDGRQCAFSRCCINPEKFLRFEGEAASTILNLEGYEILKPEYRIEDSDFWRYIQCIHDVENHWDEKGITKEGMEYVETIMNKFS